MSRPLAPLVRIPPDIVCVADYEAYARERMTASAWAYLSGGAADERTLADNLAAFSRLRLLPRVLQDLTSAHTRLELLGHSYEHPLFIAPVAYQQLAHADGERAMALAAAAMRAGMVLSTQSSTAVEEVAAHAGAPLWFQLYIQPDRAFTRDLVRRVDAAGFKALVVTVDAPVNGARNREQRAGFTLPEGIRAVNLEGMQQPSSHTAAAGESPLFASPLVGSAARWDDLASLRAETALPILLKGVLSPADARHAIDFGVDGLIVSNHGGRTLDTTVATLDALPGVVQAVAGRVPVLMDGGIRRGTDVFKALALGARAVLVGRPCMWGLAAAGAVGVVHVLHLLRAELEMAMALSGCATLADITPDALWPTARA
ncbi:MAG: alpha-hydroxy-acid oxidizing protein [Burkholderiaceae bacterium]|nr:alpha-hydroxy-acid oxidizing protein [Burkholderiaceae bacterium]